MKSKLTAPELFEQLQNKVNLALKDNEIPCPVCKGLRMVFVQKDDTTGSVKQCQNCHTGILHICPYCDKPNKSGWCSCKQYYQARDEKAKAVAKKIAWDDYKGRLLYDDYTYNKEEALEFIMDNEPDTREWYTTEESTYFEHMDLEDIIYQRCEEGYEDCDANLDIKSLKLKKAQKLIDEWESENQDHFKIWYETDTLVILPINDLGDKHEVT